MASHKNRNSLRAVTGTLLVLFLITTPLSLTARKTWVHGGFDDFSQGRFENAGSNLYERTEVRDLCDRSFDDVVDGELIGNRFPWVLECIAMRKRNSICIRIDLLDFDPHVFANRQHLARMLDPGPAELADVNQSLHTT